MEPAAYDFEVRLRPQEPAPIFDCVICEQVRGGQKFLWDRDRDDADPVCGACLRFWSDHPRLPRTSRGDHRILRKLDALITRLNWETYNGGGRSPYFP